MATVIPVDDYSPIFVGDTANTLSIYVAHKNGFMSLIGTTITMKLFNATTNTIKTCSGNFAVDPSDNGKATRTFQAADVDTAGSWEMWITVTDSNGPVHLDDGEGNAKVLVILPLPAGV